MDYQIVIYQASDNQVQVPVQFDHETVWLSQKNMAELFDKDSDTIGLHLKNIYIWRKISKKWQLPSFSR